MISLLFLRTKEPDAGFGVLTRAQKGKREHIPTIRMAKKPKIKVAKQNKGRVRNLSLKEKMDKNAPSNEYMLNEIILATIPGFCAWPARIINISNETIMVEFFGTGQMYVKFNADSNVTDNNI